MHWWNFKAKRILKLLKAMGGEMTTLQIHAIIGGSLGAIHCILWTLEDLGKVEVRFMPGGPERGGRPVRIAQFKRKD